MFSDLDESCYENIPKRYLKYKDKEFDEWEIPPWKLLIDKEKRLGSGEFGEVYLAKWNGTTVVAKVANENIPEEKKRIKALIISLYIMEILLSKTNVSKYLFMNNIF